MEAPGVSAKEVSHRHRPPRLPRGARRCVRRGRASQARRPGGVPAGGRRRRTAGPDSGVGRIAPAAGRTRCRRPPAPFSHRLVGGDWGARAAARLPGGHRRQPGPRPAPGVPLLRAAALRTRPLADADPQRTPGRGGRPRRLARGVARAGGRRARRRGLAGEAHGRAGPVTEPRPLPRGAELGRARPRGLVGRPPRRPAPAHGPEVCRHSRPTTSPKACPQTPLGNWLERGRGGGGVVVSRSVR